jgi:hypothetical protein
MLAVHADWSVDPRKRWFSLAHWQASRWRIEPPAPVGDVGSFLSALRRRAAGMPVVLGIDCPVGIPRAYAAAAAAPLAPAFPSFLRAIAAFPRFFEVCATLAEVGPHRPFYPARPRAGMTRAAFAMALGLDGPLAIARACDRRTAERPAGAPPFWTLGANQSGKAAIAAWRDLIVPALRQNAAPRLWPFEGGLHALAKPGTTVIAETYPAEGLRHLGLVLRGSKRRQADRAALTPMLRDTLERLAAQASSALVAAIADGFGADAAGEDRFDSLIGLMCVLNVLAGHRPDSAPDDPWVRLWEGWVLGQTAPPIVPPLNPYTSPPLAP